MRNAIENRDCGLRVSVADEPWNWFRRSCEYSWRIYGDRQQEQRGKRREKITESRNPFPWSCHLPKRPEYAVPPSSFGLRYISELAENPDCTGSVLCRILPHLRVVILLSTQRVLQCANSCCSFLPSSSYPRHSPRRTFREPGKAFSSPPKNPYCDQDQQASRWHRYRQDVPRRPGRPPCRRHLRHAARQPRQLLHRQP